MEIPSLNALPPVKNGRAGWPWTEESKQLLSVTPSGQPWPKISIVTPNYNYAPFLEKTIRSVLLQGYPNLEYVVIDDGSTDESVEIIKKYEAWITTWTTQANQGQSKAINNGIAYCHGEVFNWLNSDDFLAPSALEEVGLLWSRGKPHLIVGDGVMLDSKTEQVLKHFYPKIPKRVLDFIKPYRVVLSQPSTFIALNLLRECGGIRNDLRCAMDWELYIRLTKRLSDKLETTITSKVLSCALSHPKTKTNTQWTQFRKEGILVLEELLPDLSVLQRFRLSRYLRRQRNQDAVAYILTHFESPLGPLINLICSRPTVMGSRSFWGAIRKTLCGDSR